MDDVPVKDIIKQLKVIKDKEKVDFEKIKYIKNKNLQPLKINKNDLIKLPYQMQLSQDKDYIKDQMKSKFRMAWKHPGYVNQEFSHVPVLPASILSTWAQQRALAPDRSYQYPKGYRGFKTASQLSAFGDPPLTLYPANFQKSLQESNRKFQEFVMRPSKFGKLDWDVRLQKVRQDNKEPFHRTNTAQFNYFGSSKHRTFEVELHQNPKIAKACAQLYKIKNFEAS